MPKLSVALSGGGHRASLFALGALQYLVDAQKNADVVSIASVSGGSLTNGFVGQTLQFNAVDGETFEHQVTAPFLRQLTGKGTLFAPLVTKLYIALLVVAALAVAIVPWFLTFVHFGWRVLIFVAGVIAVLALAWLRGSVCRQALRSTLFSPNGTATKLTDMKPGIDHVLCATDLQSGDHFYFTRNLAYGYRFGTGTPGSIDLATAAGASAALPGAFTPATVKTDSLRLTGGREGAEARSLRLVDGGVYDNMGDQWAAGYAERVERLPDHFADRVPDELVVVNASSGATWTPTTMLGLPGIGEVKALLRDKDILYDNTTAHRRTALIDRFDLARERGDGMTGSYVGINQSPYRVAEFFEHDAERGARAAAVLRLLDAGPIDRDGWAKVTTASDGMSTNLSRIDRRAAADLVWHAYVVTMCNLHILLDYPITGGLPPRDRFLV